MTILIVAPSEDWHANLVQAALESLNASVRRMEPDKLPGKSHLSFTASSNGCSFDDVLDLGPGDTIWLRRIDMPRSFDNRLDPGDRAVAEQESKLFWRSLLMAVSDEARWVNSIAANSKCSSKLLQLKVAAEVGLPVPQTLISNDPSRVRDFLNSEYQKFVFKSLAPVNWKSVRRQPGDTVRALYTTKIALADLAGTDDAMLAAAPAIYQQYLQAKKEYRVTMFGDRHVAVEVIASHNQETVCDWRLGYYGKVEIVPTALPTPVIDRLRTFMTRLGLQYCAFDLLEDHDGIVWFLEGNEGGQFLWVEQYNPDIRILEQFCNFLLNRGPQDAKIKLLDFDSGPEKMVQNVA